MSGYIDYEDAYPPMTPEEEHQAWLDDCLAEVRWPIEDEGYLEALDAQAAASLSPARVEGVAA